MTSGSAFDAIFRASYARLIAILASRSGDISAAQDQLSAAFERALSVWPRSGVPANPAAWLLTVARRIGIDDARRATTLTTVSIHPDDDSDAPAFDIGVEDADPQRIPDERLKLLFVCAHPAIDESVRTALMLQTVLGLEASHIAKAYLVPEATLAQRLVRAKQKIKLARLPFDIPQRADMPERLDAVLEAAYGAYAVHYSAAQDHATRDGDLALACDTADADLGREALYLAQLLSELLPDVPEVQGLAALLCYSESRRAARLGAGGGFVALAAQDTRLWNSALIAQGNDLLRRAQTSQMGRFQIEAAIQSAHTERWYGRATDWNAIAQLYEALLRIAPSIGAQVAQASALTQAGHMEAALVRLDALHQSCEVQIASFQPYWVTRAHAERLAGRDQAAALSRDRAITLTTSTAVRHYLLSIK